MTALTVLYLIEGADDRAPIGFTAVLILRTGNKHVHALHIPTLSHIKIDVADLERQRRRGLVFERPVKPTKLRRQIKAKRQLYRDNGMRFAGVFVSEALETLTPPRKETSPISPGAARGRDRRRCFGPDLSSGV